MKLVTVLGPLDSDLAGITDAHNHAWIEPVPGGPPDAPVLNDQEAILKELIEYREAGGSTLVGGNIVRCLTRPFPIATDEEDVR